MTKIKWDESFSVNHAELDGQHKRWINIYNELSEAFANCGLEEVNKITADALRAMEDYTRKHFEYEEEYMKSINYPDGAGHRRLHKDFDTKIFESNRNMKEGKIVLTSEVIKDIENWIIDHILNEDKKYAQYQSS